MSDELRILFIEDSPEDVELEERVLNRAGFSVRAKRVETREGILEGLEQFNPRLIISDFALPRMNGLDALRMVREIQPETPFIFVSGTIGEERAIESLKSGATDYVVKNSLAALPSKVRRALSEVEERSRRLLLEEQVRQTQKLEAIGRLAGGVAHDFNNLLTVINGYSEMVLAQMDEANPIKADIREVHAAGMRAAALTRQLLMFSRKQVTQPAVLDLNLVATGVKKMLERVIGEDVKLALELDPTIHKVLADAGQIEQVLMNLAVNARDAMPEGGKITIETGNVQLDEKDPRRPAEATTASFVLLSVTDTGTGITSDVKAHMFEPFFTTKESGKGTGLGLSTVHGIVKQAGGSIQVESEVGRGSTFSICLPRSAASFSVAAGEPRPSTQADRGAGTVLVVDDQESIRRLVAAIVSTSGYTVMVAQSGAEALKLCEDREDPFDLLLTDIAMRSMNGIELARLVKRVHPETKVIFMSGYADRWAQEEGLAEQGATFLHKPFTVQDLRAKVRDVLAGG